MNAIYQIATSVRVSKDELDELNRIQDVYKISVSLLVLYLCKEIADKLKGGLSMCNGCSGTHFIIREALSIYAPFEKARPFESYSFTIQAKMGISYMELQSNLKEVGILNVAKLIRAIIRTAISYPDNAAICKINGLLNRKYASPYRVRKYNNERLGMHVRIYPFLKDKITSISEKTGITVNDLIVNAIKALCDIEFDNGNSIPNNADIMRTYILQSSDRNICKREYGFISVYVADIKYSVQTLILMEKYGVPGKQEFISRVINFIVDSANGGIQLVNETIEDDEDYNETRLVRNAYRKEVTYANAY